MGSRLAKNESVSPLDAILIHKAIAKPWQVQSTAEVVDCGSGNTSQPQCSATCFKPL